MNLLRRTRAAPGGAGTDRSSAMARKETSQTLVWEVFRWHICALGLQDWVIKRLACSVGCPA